jgi:hypothetical protein
LRPSARTQPGGASSARRCRPRPGV